LSSNDEDSHDQDDIGRPNLEGDDVKRDRPKPGMDRVGFIEDNR
jgi:hypothetical protein